MSVKRIWFNTVLIFFLPVVCLAQELSVAVSANLQYTFEELKTAFEKQTKINLEGIVASSGALTIQIENGAPFDIFLSADMGCPKVLFEKGLTVNSPQIYAYGTLVLWTMREINLAEGMKVLTDPRVKKIALGLPQTAPYGQEAVNVLKYYNLYSKLEEKLVYAESLAQVNQFILSQAADVGFTAKSAVLAGGMKNQGQWIEIEKEAYRPIAQGAVILKNAQGQKLEAAQDFSDFLSSESARKIFERHGYVLP